MVSPRTSLSLKMTLFVQKALKVYLEGEGYRMSACDNGKDMHALMAADPADLAIMDIKLPNDDATSSLPESSFARSTRLLSSF